VQAVPLHLGRAVQVSCTTHMPAHVEPEGASASQQPSLHVAGLFPGNRVPDAPDPDCAYLLECEPGLGVKASENDMPDVAIGKKRSRKDQTSRTAESQHDVALFEKKTNGCEGMDQAVPSVVRKGSIEVQHHVPAQASSTLHAIEQLVAGPGGVESEEKSSIPEISEMAAATIAGQQDALSTSTSSLPDIDSGSDPEVDEDV
jgi:hypothetical protein